MRFKSANYLLTIVTILGAMLAVGCHTEPDNTTPPADETQAFNFERITPLHTSLSVDIVPEDAECEYIILMSDKDYFTRNSIDTREKLLADDLAYFTSLAERYQMPIHDLLEAVEWLNKGTKRGYSATNLYPDTEYVVYCYGVEFDGETYQATTDICYEVIRTTAPEMVDAQFSIESTVEGNMATINIDTNGYKGYYYHYVISENDAIYLTEGKTINNDFIRYFRNTTFTTFNRLINEQGIPVSEFCAMGDKSFTERYAANTRYMVVSFAVSKEQTPLLCSVPSLGYFQTGDTQYSDLELDIEISNITPYKATLNIDASNNEPYACIFVSEDQLPRLDDEQEAMEMVVEYYQPAIINGDYTEELLPLIPNREYAVVAFGCDKGIPTTHLYIERFTTPESVEGKSKIDGFEVLYVYDVDEIVALDSSFAEPFADFECVFIATVHTTPATDRVYWWWYEDWMLESYGEDAFLEDLLMYDPTPTTELMGLWYDVPVFFAGMAEDDEGNLSKIHYGEVFTLTRDMCDPAEDFFKHIVK